MKFFKIPNKIFSYKLKPSAFIIYIYLSSTFYWKKSINIKLETIACKTNMSINTAQTAINELIKKGLIHKTECYINRKRVTNEYIITNLDGGFAMVEKNITKLNIDNRAFMILCYIYSRANQSLKSYPSISEIQKGTGIGRTTVISKVRILQVIGLLYKQHYMRREGDYGQNNHTLIKLQVRIILFSLINRIASFFSEIAATIKFTKKCIRFKKIAYQIIAKFILIFTFIREYLANFWRIRNTP